MAGHRGGEGGRLEAQPPAEAAAIGSAWSLFAEHPLWALGLRGGPRPTPVRQGWCDRLGPRRGTEVLLSPQGPSRTPAGSTCSSRPVTTGICGCSPPAAGCTHGQTTGGPSWTASGPAELAEPRPRTLPSLALHAPRGEAGPGPWTGHGRPGRPQASGQGGARGVVQRGQPSPPSGKPPPRPAAAWSEGDVGAGGDNRPALNHGPCCPAPRGSPPWTCPGSSKHGASSGPCQALCQGSSLGPASDQLEGSAPLPLPPPRGPKA